MRRDGRRHLQGRVPRLDIAGRQFDAAHPGLRRMIDEEVPALEAGFDTAGIRSTTGRGAPGG